MENSSADENSQSVRQRFAVYQQNIDENLTSTQKSLKKQLEAANIRTPNSFNNTKGTGSFKVASGYLTPAENDFAS